MGKLSLVSTCLLVFVGAVHCGGRSAPRSADAGLDAPQVLSDTPNPDSLDLTEVSRSSNEDGEVGGNPCDCEPGFVCSPFDDPNVRCVHHCYSVYVDGDETDVNCGGSECKRCLPGKKCRQGSDCASGECRGEACAGTCSDGLLTDDETNVDCGGAHCPACTVDFAPAISTAVGVEPFALGTGDFDQDERLDLAVVDGTANVVLVLKGRVDGTFDSPQSIPVGKRPVSLVAADLNGDGALDLATTDFYDDALTVLAGDGLGGFGPLGHLQLESNARPRLVTAGDLDQDGKQDLVVSCFHYKNNSDDGGLGANDVRVWFNQGGGAFKPGDRWSAGENPTKAAVADLNGDGHLDLAVGEDGGDGVLVLLGTGAGAMKPAQRYRAFGPVKSVLAMDLSGNGSLYLVAANRSYYTVSVLPPLGNGTFGAPTHYDLWGDSWDIVAGDFNRDGLPDVASLDVHKGVSILIAKGNGALAEAALTFPVKGAPRTLVSGDFNGDGRTDVATLSYDKALLEVLLGR